MVGLLAACADPVQTATVGGAPDEAPLPTAVPTQTPTDLPTPKPTGQDSLDPPSTPPPTRSPEPTPTPLAPLQGLAGELVTSGFQQPVLVTSAPGTDALFVVERAGTVQVVVGGERQETPFLDLRGGDLLSNSIEQGLLGLAFHPDYATNGRGFLYWTRGSGDSVLAEFSGNGTDPLDPSQLKPLLEIPQPAERHNAGNIAIGPDGLLYLSLGDGGSGGSTAQDTSNLLGTVLRLDIDSGDPYAIPEGNPFGDEIWVYGLRNPWRFSIDPVDRFVFIGDVGQDTYEEINIVGLDGAGTNFGWFEAEGDQCFRSGCDLGAYTAPVLQYSHDDGCSVTGGYVYRGSAIPEFIGHYFFADWCTGIVRSFRYADGNAVDLFDWTNDIRVGEVTSFGIGADAELYTVNWAGELHKIVPIRDTD